VGLVIQQATGELQAQALGQRHGLLRGAFC
jgi:hypothetical protein